MEPLDVIRHIRGLKNRAGGGKDPNINSSRYAAIPHANLFMALNTGLLFGFMIALAPTQDVNVNEIDRSPLNYTCTLSVNSRLILKRRCAALTSETGGIEWDDRRIRYSCNGLPGYGECDITTVRMRKNGFFGLLSDDSNGYLSIYWNRGSSVKAEYGYSDLRRTSSDCWESKSAKQIDGNRIYNVRFCILGWQ